VTAISVVMPRAFFLIGFVSANVIAAGTGTDPGEKGVREVEDGWSAAFVTGNVAYLDALLDPAYVSVGTKGNARPKSGILALAGRYATEHPDTHPTPLPPTSTIDVKSSAAIVTHYNKNETSVDVFYYANGHWRAWYSQHTAIAPAN